MKIIWSLFAFKMLKDIYTYHKKAAGKLVASKIKNEIFSNVRQLGEHQKIGHTDPILENLSEGHRYFVTGNYKIVYKKVKKGILITDVFDVRQDPNKLNDSKR